MAKQSEVVGPREYMSYQWYRRIGEHRYRFRWTPKPNISPGAYQVVVDQFVKWMEWKRVHTIVIKGSGD